MRRARIKGSREEGAVYHCMSRVVAGARLLDAAAKDVLVRHLEVAAGFSGLRLLTHAVLDNHFHVLVHVPPAGPVADDELVRRYALLHPRPTEDNPASPRVLRRLLAAGGPAAEQWRRRLLRRMGDPSEFMKTLKERFTLWFNRQHARQGTLWCERFRSVLVEGRAEALLTVAAYIDLNPVRAGLCTDPARYRWCGHAAAAAGDPGALHGLACILGSPAAGPPAARAARALLREYRLLLFSKGAAPRAGAAALDAREAQAVLERGGRLPVDLALRLRVRQLTRGVILGSPAFVAAHAPVPRPPQSPPPRPPAPVRRSPRPARARPLPALLGRPEVLSSLVRPRAERV